MRHLGIGLIGIFMVGMCGDIFCQDNSVNASSGRSSRSSSRSSRSSSSGDSSNKSNTSETTNDRERRRESRSKERESNSRSSRKTEKEGSKTTQPNGQAAATPGKETKTVQGSKPAASKGKSGGGPKQVEIKFEMQADPETNIMYLEGISDNPSLNISVLEKKKFLTRLALYNPKSSNFSQVDASIKYDPMILRPVAVDDSSMASNLTSPARIKVDKANGLLSLAADFKEERTDSFLNIAKIQWEALQPVASSPIRFVNTKNHPSGVFSGSGQNILHLRSDGTVEMSANAGLLDASVSVEATDGTTMEVAESGNPLSAVALATNINSGTAEGGIRLYLKPRVSSVQVGQEFLVDINYDNPRQADMDTVKLKLRFDPEVLQVVDADQDNWITRGINIYDGAYHEELPFDNHRKNMVYNNTGIILYDNGFGSRTPVPESGTIATIKFQAIRSAVSTPVVFSLQDENTMKPETAISFLGFNLIGVPGQRAQALGNTELSIRR